MWVKPIHFMKDENAVGCKSCIEKRVQMYVARGMSRANAERQAKKIMPLIENALNKREIKIVVKSGKGNPSDYMLSCVAGGTLGCSKGEECYDKSDCWDTRNCTCSCPDPLPNSHYVSDNCLKSGKNCSCVFGTCGGVGQCICLFICAYDCDEGYEWNGEACVPIAPKIKAGLHPSKVMVIIAD